MNFFILSCTKYTILSIATLCRNEGHIEGRFERYLFSIGSRCYEVVCSPIPSRGDAHRLSATVNTASCPRCTRCPSLCRGISSHREYRVCWGPLQTRKDTRQILRPSYNCPFGIQASTLETRIQPEFLIPDTSSKLASAGELT